MSFRSDKINKHAMLTKVAHKYSAMQKTKNKKNIMSKNTQRRGFKDATVHSNVPEGSKHKVVPMQGEGD